MSDEPTTVFTEAEIGRIIGERDTAERLRREVCETHVPADQFGRLREAHAAAVREKNRLAAYADQTLRRYEASTLELNALGRKYRQAVDANPGCYPELLAERDGLRARLGNSESRCALIAGDRDRLQGELAGSQLKAEKYRAEAERLREENARLRDRWSAHSGHWYYSGGPDPFLVTGRIEPRGGNGGWRVEAWSCGHEVLEDVFATLACAKAAVEAAHRECPE